MIRCLAITLAVFIVTGSALAEQRATYIRGWGEAMCERWTAERPKNPPVTSAAMANWIFGFIGAYNAYMHKGPGTGVDQKQNNNALLAKIDSYCKANPKQNLAHASVALVKELGGTEPPALGTTAKPVPGGAAPKVAPAEAIKPPPGEAPKPQ